MSRTIPEGIRPPPAGCKVIIEGRPDGFTITIPPHGFLRGSGCGLLLFALLWLGFTILITMSCYDHAPTRHGVPQPLDRYLFPLIFWGISIGLVLLIVSNSRQRAVLTLTEDRLRIEEACPFSRKRTGEWKRSQLFAICAGPTPRGGSPNLEIYPWGQPPFTLSYIGPALELEWLAGVLRQGLGLSMRGDLAGARVGVATRGPSPVARWRDDFEAKLCNWIYRIYQGRELRRFAEVSRSMNLAFQPKVSREDLRDFFYLRLFRYWKSARNRMAGVIDGIPVDMLDCTISFQRSPLYLATVVLLPAPGSGLPPFELCRRGLIDRLFSHAQESAEASDTMIKPYKGQPPHIRKCHERFWLQYYLRRYYLSDHFEDAASRVSFKDSVRDLWQLCRNIKLLLWDGKLAKDPEHYPLKSRDHADNGLDPDRAGTEPEVQRFFNLDLLHFFAEHPGWCIQSDGAHLALWRPNRTIRAAQRPRFIAEALEVYRALARAGAPQEKNVRNLSPLPILKGS